jgi:hypothetical protein
MKKQVASEKLLWTGFGLKGPGFSPYMSGLKEPGFTGRGKTPN